MTERLFQFIWQHRLYEQSNKLKTIEGLDVIVIKTGELNKHAGPDFLNAQVKIGHTTWAGNIEIHLKSSDWNKHSHQQDLSYATLILHVVYEYDEAINTYDNKHFPSLELKHHINNSLIEKYQMLMEQQVAIPCTNSIQQVSSMIVQQQLDRMLAERLEDKTSHILDLLERYNHNWQEVFYIMLAKGFGIHINQSAFESMAMQTPLQLFAKHKHQLLQIEALLFGQAGFLDDYFEESYPLSLQQEYLYLKKLYSLQGIEKQRWKFLRLRPANFPTLRLAQFAHLLHGSSHLFSKILEANTIQEVEKFFAFTVSPFWLNHYTFQEKSIEKNKSLGKTFIQTIILNVVIPTLFIYGKLHAKNSVCDKAIDWLKAMKVEKNNIITLWSTIGIQPHSAADSQALLQLKNNYCDRKKCLECSIGYAILNPQKN